MTASNLKTLLKQEKFRAKGHRRSKSNIQFIGDTKSLVTYSTSSPSSPTLKQAVSRTGSNTSNAPVDTPPPSPLHRASAGQRLIDHMRILSDTNNAIWNNVSLSQYTRKKFFDRFSNREGLLFVPFKFNIFLNLFFSLFFLSEKR